MCEILCGIKKTVHSTTFLLVEFLLFRLT